MYSSCQVIMQYFKASLSNQYKNTKIMECGLSRGQL